MPSNTGISDLKCLVISGNKHERTLLNATLRTIDIHDTVMAAEADSGMEILRTQMIDLVIVDMELSEISGIDFTRLVRRGNLAPQPNVPIIMIARNHEKRAVLLAAQAGVQAFVVKPLTAGALEEKIIRFALGAKPPTRKTANTNRAIRAINH